MTSPKSAKNPTSFVFNVEILVEGENNALALEQLLSSLNNGNFIDYRILSGIQLGEQIDERKANAASIKNISVTNPSSAGHQQKDVPAAQSLDGLERIKSIMKDNTLIRLAVNKGLGIKINIPCRIINMDEKEQLITVYHVDEKQVYTFRMTEIEDFYV
ncbi:hypothetical protein D3C78_1485710 [compost metagenome]